MKRKRSFKKCSKKSCKRSSKSYKRSKKRFGTTDRRTLSVDGPRLYSVHYGPDGILLANNAFQWQQDPMNRALNAGI